MSKMRKEKRHKASLGRLKVALARKQRQVQKPLPEGRLKHLNAQIRRIEDYIVDREQGMANQLNFSQVVGGDHGRYQSQDAAD